MVDVSISVLRRITEGSAATALIFLLGRFPSSDRALLLGVAFFISLHDHSVGSSPRIDGSKVDALVHFLGGCLRLASGLVLIQGLVHLLDVDIVVIGMNLVRGGLIVECSI